MSETELLQAMWKAYTSVSDPRPFRAHDAMRAVLDVLHANGYRRCAEGQRTTQWCDRAEKAEAEVERLRVDAANLLSALRAIRAVAEQYDSAEWGVVKDCANLAIDAARGES